MAFVQPFLYAVVHRVDAHVTVPVVTRVLSGLEIVNIEIVGAYLAIL